MADVVTVQTIEDGARNLVMRFTNVSDGTGEAGVIKVNASSAHSVVAQGQTVYPGVHLKVIGIHYDCKGMGLRIQWVGTSNADIFALGEQGSMDFREFGGIPNPGVTALPGSTGSIAFTTIAAAAGATYTVILRMTKGVPQS